MMTVFKGGYGVRSDEKLSRLENAQFWVVALFWMSTLSMANASPQVIENETIESHKRYESLGGFLVRDNFVVKDRGRVEFHVRNTKSVLFKPGAKAKRGAQMTVHLVGDGEGDYLDEDGDGLLDSWEILHFGDLSQDSATQGQLAGSENPNDPANQKPFVVAAYPTPGKTVPSQGQSVEFSTVFVHPEGKVATPRLRDAFGNLVEFGKKISDNGMSINLGRLGSGDYRYTVELVDESGEVHATPIQFRVDAVVPVTSVSQHGGLYNAPFSVKLGLSESGTLYYTTDGYPPSIGRSGTLVQIIQTPKTQHAVIPITRNTTLQFFSIDTAGNREPLRTEVYKLHKPPTSPAGLSLSLAQGHVDLSWSGVGAVYHVYRAVGSLDTHILRERREQGVPPPALLRITPGGGITNASYQDSVLPAGVSAYYGVTQEHDGVESVMTPLVSIASTSALSTASEKDAKFRAVVWLLSKQNKNGSWADTGRVQTTSQVLRAFSAAKVLNAGVQHGAFWLLGAFAKSNRTLAHQIDTLSRYYGLDVTAKRVQLLGRGHFEGSVLLGWGANKGFRPDPASTALALITPQPAPLSLKGTDHAGKQYVHLMVDFLLGILNPQQYGIDDPRTSGSTFSSPRYGWSPKGRESFWVSARVYFAMRNAAWDPDVPSSLNDSWLTSQFTQDTPLTGYYGKGLADTAAALLWLDSNAGVALQRQHARQYLVDQQLPDGSWNGDAHLTALCLEALARSSQ